MARRVLSAEEALMEVNQCGLSETESDDDELDLTMEESIFDDSDSGPIDTDVESSGASDEIVTGLMTVVGVLGNQMTLTFLIVHLQFKIQGCIFHPNLNQS